jgi:ABC-type polysaccharide/polyol phosphate export permease
MYCFKHLADLYINRQLVRALVGRELKARYRGSVLGFLWTFLNPLMLLLVYALVFSVYMRVEMDNYTVFMFTGLLPWIFFSQSLNSGASSVTAGRSLVTKVQFPMQVLPAVQVIANFVNYLLSLPVLVAFLLIFKLPLSLPLLAFPLVAGLHLMFTYGCALWLASANVFLRDVQHLMNSLTTLWFFLTPILYPPSFVPPEFNWVLKLNPATYFITAYHDMFFWGRWPSWQNLAVMAGLGLVMLITATAYFRSRSDYFAERV